MKVFLIIPNIAGQYFRTGQPHVGVAYLAGSLLKNGHDVKVADLRVEPDEVVLYRNIRKFKPDLLGVTCVSLGYLNTYKLITRLKKKFKIPIIIGGPHVATFREKVLKESDADMAAIGEGEETLLDLIKNLPQKKLDNVKGLIWKKNKMVINNPPRPFIQDLDRIPFPAFHVFPMKKYFDKKIPIVTSRGCPGNCTYCMAKILLGQRFRPRSPENVLEEIEYWYRKGYNFFEFNDDCFSADIKRAEKICDLMIKNNLQISWEIRNGIRVDRITPKLAKKMRNAGCRFVAFGVESADQEVLRLMKKGILLKQVKRAFKIMKKVGIGINAFFMIGTPGDTFKKFLKTYRFAESANPDEVRFYNTIPYPGTELFEWIKSNGKFLIPPERYLNEIERWEGKPVFETDNFSAEERAKAFKMAEKLVMKKFFKKYFKFFYFIPYFFWSNRLLRNLTSPFGQKVWLEIRKVVK